MAQYNVFQLWRRWRRRHNLRLAQKHLRNALHADEDILSEKQLRQMEDLIVEAENLGPEDGEKVDRFVREVPERVEACLARKRSRFWRDLADVAAVAGMVAFGIRGLFLQPFQIPTGSMQPTLFGIHYVARGVYPDLGRGLNLVLFGLEPAAATVKEPGRWDPASCYEVSHWLLFTDTVFRIGNVSYRLPGAVGKVREYCSLSDDYDYYAGEVLCRGWLSSGDHLFVDRYSHHLFGFRRGDVVVFNTEGLYFNGRPLKEKGSYYIKRLIGLPGDTLQIRDEMVYVRPEGGKEFRPITAFNPAFDKLYSQRGG
ncbi:MAG: S26 family signal peptidase, partial [Victivallales bacterium]|nr:S26 family signal peptidase [Victivallales bacterium]